MASKFRDVRGKTAIVTGSARGLGRGMAETLAAEGVNVVMADISSAIESVFAEVKRANPDLKGFGARVDVTVESEVERLIQEAVRELSRLDIMVNDAAICTPEPDVVDMPADLIDRVMAVNFKGVFFGSKYAARQMIAQGCGGTIVNMGSYCAKIAFPNLACYNASKAAVRSLTQTLALELARYGITVNCLCPGDAATDMHWGFVARDAKAKGVSIDDIKKEELERIPLGRYGRGSDYAGAIMWLASESGAYVTGQAINVDGGKNYFC